MISRLTASAAAFAILATAALGVAAEAQQRTTAGRVATLSASAPVIVLPKVEITGKRLARR